MQLRYVKFLVSLLLICLGLNTAYAFAATGLTPLPADEAFSFSTSFYHPNELMAQWQIAPGYYLYVQKLHVFVQPGPVKIDYPQGELRSDPVRGSFEAYSGLLNIPVPLLDSQKTVTMTVDYQGCSEGGFCYPPMHKEFSVNAVNQTITENHANPEQIAPARDESSLSALMSDQNGVRGLLAGGHIAALMLVFAALGLLLAFTPCVLPMIPILTSIIIGHKQPLSGKKAFLLSSTYVLGSAVTYSLAGVAAAMMGGSLQAWLQQPWIIAATSGLFVILSLSLFGLYDLRLPRLWQHHITALSRKQQGGSYAGVFIMGIVSTLIVSPCVTAPLVGVLMYIGQTGNVVLGAAALFAMGIGMGIPLLVIGVSARKVLPKSGPWMVLVKQFFGLLMLGMAVWLFSRIPSHTIKMESLGVILLLAGVLAGIYLSRVTEWRRLNQCVGTCVALLGALVMINGSGWMNLTPSWLSASGNASGANSFIIVSDLDALNQQLAQAQLAHKPVLLDFYADWCESCVAMDKNVFSTPDVINVLKNFVLLRADLTSNNMEDEALLKNYSVVAPPTVLFFNNDGREVNSRRIVGEVSAREFITRINTFMSASCDKKMQC